MQSSNGVNPKIFKAYDIRGIYPQEINEQVAYQIGRAFVKFLRKKNPRIVVGRDSRLSSFALFKYLARGIVDEGGDVVNIGLATSPMLYFAAAHFKYDGGIEISASHNPARYNGFKIVRGGAVPVSGESGLEEIKKMVLKNNFKKARKKGKISNKKILKEYIKFNFSRTPFLEKRRGVKIVVDTANAVPGILIPEISKKISSKIYHLFSELDGTFPNHPPDPLKKENLKTLCRTVKGKKADLGVAFDGDGDRIIFVDERGKIISGDLITALFAKLILKKEPGGKILYDLRSSNIVRETIKESAGVPVAWKIGHSLIKGKMRKETIIFGGELSGHYYHQDHYFSECPIFILVKILETILTFKKPFSQIIKPFQKYFHSGEINFEAKNKQETLKKLEKKFKSDKVLKVDGLRVDFKDWWFLVRPSNTEPVIRLVVEAKTKKLLSQKIKELIPLF